MVHGVGRLLHSAQAQLELQAPSHNLRAQLLFRALGFLCFHSFCGARVLGRFCLSAYEAELCKVRAGPYADRCRDLPSRVSNSTTLVTKPQF